jgi:hypothetical protein
VEVPNSGPDGNFYVPSLAVDGRGCWHVTMSWNIPFDENSRLFYATSGDSGTSWSPVLLLTEAYITGSSEQSLAVDESGYVALVRAIPEFEEVVFRSNAAPIPPDELQPDEEVLVRSERNPSGVGVLSVLYQLVSPGEVMVSLRDASGRLVRRWDEGQTTAGEHQLEWDGLTRTDKQVASGVYYWEVSVATDEGVSRGRSSTVVVR